MVRPNWDNYIRYVDQQGVLLLEQQIKIPEVWESLSKIDWWHKIEDPVNRIDMLAAKI